MAVPVAKDQYEIIEIYNVQTQSITSNFGNWSDTSVRYSSLEIYQRRNDFRGTLIPYSKVGKAVSVSIPEPKPVTHLVTIV